MEWKAKKNKTYVTYTVAFCRINDRACDSGVFIFNHQQSLLFLRTLYHRKEVFFMSEKEKDIIRKLSDTVPKLDKDKQNYILGVAEGMAIAKEEISGRGTNKE